METTIKNYEQQATDFANKHGITLTVLGKTRGRYFEDDQDTRDIYDLVLSRGGESYNFKFGQSTHNSRKFVITDKDGKHYYANNRSWTSRGKAEQALSKVDGSGYKIREVKGVEPTMYDVLACLTKYDPETFVDFCDTFGYSSDSISALKTYQAVKQEYQGVCRVMGDLMDDEEFLDIC